jgi:Fructose-1-phosphate kinase and related fructose-6-phosphate kinase (PfkB)
LEKENITTLPIETINPTRENLVIKEMATQRQYRFGMPGAELSPNEWQDCLKTVEQLSHVDYLVISGSLPSGAPANIFSKIAEICRTKKIKLIVDTSGESLRHAVEAGVFLIKPNLKELATLVNQELLPIDQVAQASKTVICNYECEAVITSLGAQGAMLVTSNIVLRITPPQVDVQSTVGAGDSMLAGIIMGLCDRKNIVESVQYGVACGTAATLNSGTELCHFKDAQDLFRRTMCSLTSA